MLTELELTQPTTTAQRSRRPDLSVLQRLLPVIGGTVTEVLEHHLGEPLKASWLSQRTGICADPLQLPLLDLAVGESMLQRRVLLCGATTSAPVLYAESAIALDRIDPSIRHGLLATHEPIGRLIRDHRMEVFREPLSFERVGAPDVAARFGMPRATRLPTRTYRMWNKGHPIMLITEWFAC